jgi:hypothetical protein
MSTLGTFEEERTNFFARLLNLLVYFVVSGSGRNYDHRLLSKVNFVGLKPCSASGYHVVSVQGRHAIHLAQSPADCSRAASASHLGLISLRD